MKTMFKTIFAFAAAAIAFASCVKEGDAPVSETKTVQFVAESIETKTAFGTPDGTSYPTLWTEGDKVKILVNLESVANTEKTATVKCSEDFKSANFKAELIDPNPDDGSYTFYSICPSTAMVAKTTEKLYVQIPNMQTPDDTSVDKAAQLLYAASETTTGTMPASVELRYKHLTAYGKLSLANLTSDVSSVSSIKIAAPEGVNLSGNWDYFVADGSFVVRSGKGSNTITLTTAKTTDIWFACAPVDVSGQSLTLTVTTDKGDLTKIITFPANRKFEAGRIAKFTVDMAGIKVEEEEVTACYEKVTSEPADWTGKYLIVYEDGTKAYVFNGIDAVNGYVSAIIDGNIIASTAELDAVAVDIESMSGGYSIKTANGYISGDSGSNKLYFNNNQQKNTISYSDNCVMITSGRVLRFNSASNQMRFRYYSAGTQQPIQLYKLADGESGSDTPEDKTLTSISVTGQKTDFTVGDEFEFGGTVTATYSDGSTKDVTSEVSVTEPEMVDGATVTVSYTEGTITKTVEYTISVKTEGAEIVLTTEEITFTTKDQRISQDSNSQVWKQGNVTFTNDKAQSSDPVGDYSNPVRLYAGSTVTISATGNITKVVINSNGTAKYKIALENSLKGAGYTYTNTGNDYTLTFAPSTNKVHFSLTAQARFVGLTVTYEN